MKKILLLITLLCFSACVYSADWQQKGPIYIDNTTVVKTEDNVQAWIIRPNFEKSKIYNPKYTYDMAFVDARCKVSEMAFLNTKWYNNRHELVEGVTTGEMPQDYFKVKPNTNNEVIFKALCPKPERRKS